MAVPATAVGKPAPAPEAGACGTRRAGAGFAIVAVVASLHASAADDPLASIAWLAGCWRAVDADPGSGERWMPAAGGSMLGMSRTLKGARTIAHESMRISAAPDGRLVFHAQPSGKPPAAFTATVTTPEEIVFENLEHDFPQRVAYRLEAPDRLEARIEGLRGGALRTIRYPMERTACPAGPAVVRAGTG